MDTQNTSRQLRYLEEVRIPLHRAGDAGKGDILFLEREYPPYTPKRKDEGPSPSTPLHWQF